MQLLKQIRTPNLPLEDRPHSPPPPFPAVQRLSDLLSFSGFLSACSSCGGQMRDAASISCFLVTSFFLLLILYVLLPPPCCHSPDFFLFPLIFLKYMYLFILFLAALGLCCCARAFSSCGEQGLLFVAVRGLLTAVASLAAEHGL